MNDLSNLSHTICLQTRLCQFFQQRSWDGRYKVEVVLLIELCSAVLTHTMDVGIGRHYEVHSYSV